VQFAASYFQAANKYDYAGTFIWAVSARVPETAFLAANGYQGYPGYNFVWGQVVISHNEQ